MEHWTFGTEFYWYENNFTNMKGNLEKMNGGFGHWLLSGEKIEQEDPTKSWSYLSHDNQVLAIELFNQRILYLQEEIRKVLRRPSKYVKRR
jgi:hypothetical protein